VNLSPHFTLDELTRSDVAARRGLLNVPTPTLVENLKFLAEGLERVRELLKAPLEVSSGYRSPAVNAAVGGSIASQHRFGLAADFRAPQFGDPLEVCNAILASDIQFDQMIYEFESWTHISFVRREPRREALTVMTLNGKAGPYKPGILPALRYRGF
jgi:hypothetical protein